LSTKEVGVNGRRCTANLKCKSCLQALPTKSANNLAAMGSATPRSGRCAEECDECAPSHVRRYRSESDERVGSGLSRVGNVRFGSKSGRDALKFRCPLYPRKRTFESAFWMSALGHKQTYRRRPGGL
jgi:hypothetical protein